MDSISSKLLSTAGQLIKSKNPIKHNACQELYALVDEGVYVLDTSLKLSTFRFISKYCEIHCPQIEPIMQSVFFTNKSKNKIVSNFLWFICFNCIRSTSITESNIIRGAGNVEENYQTMLEIASKTEGIIKLILKQLYGENVTIPIELLSEPGLNNDKLLSYLSKNYINLNNLKPIGMLPIYQLFYLFNIDSKYWGSLVWYTLHMMAESISMYPENDIFKLWRNFLINDLADCLPCVYCSEHWKYLMKADETLRTCTAVQLPKIMHTLHNQVSKNINQPEMAWEEYKIKIQPEIKQLIKL